MLKVIFAPNASSISALPHLLDTLLFPCFATLTPAAATTKEVTVDILKVLVPSPPVPTISITVSCVSSLLQQFLIATALPVISSTVSPFSLKADIYAPI